MQIHGRINGGFLAAGILIGNALMDMYAGFNMLGRAKQVLQELPVRDVISWSALIAEYVQQGQGEKALSSFEEMQSEGLSPDGIIFSSILKACGSIRAVEKGKKIHREILNTGFLDKDIVLGNALVDFYIKCGMFAKAHDVFHEIPSRNVASWNTIIAAHAQQGQGHEALNCFEKMLSEGQTPDEITILCILKACGSTGALAKGKEIHDKLISRDLLEKHPMLGNALVDMYAKCGDLTPAQEVHEELSVRDLTCWNALITGFSQQGQGREALRSLEQMQSDGLSPNGITCLSVLSACSHNGLVEESQMLFESMRTKYGLTPGVEHHTCMIMALGCAGKFDHAMSVIKAMPSPDCPTVWVALLDACRKWGNLKLGILVFGQVIQLDDGCASAYILIAGMFASTGMLKDAEKVEIMRQRYATSKMQGNASGDG
jgi:pentatricopeptide repeat protein